MQHTLFDEQIRIPHDARVIQRRDTFCHVFSTSYINDLPIVSNDNLFVELLITFVFFVLSIGIKFSLNAQWNHLHDEEIGILFEKKQKQTNKAPLLIDKLRFNYPRNTWTRRTHVLPRLKNKKKQQQHLLRLNWINFYCRWKSKSKKVYDDEYRS